MSLQPKDSYTLVLDRNAINQAVKKAALDVNNWAASLNKNEPIIALSLLKGAVFFTADLMRELNFSPEVEFKRIVTYDVSTNKKLDGNQISGLELDFDISGSNILIIDDICDTGKTLQYLVRELKSLGASDVKSVVLINRAKVYSSEYAPDFFGVELDFKDWLVGLGLDDNGKYRNLPEVYKMT